jgi:L-alanine-DL-glutamate epimerase-like enolase superfamily enzyme
MPIGSSSTSIGATSISNMWYIPMMSKIERIDVFSYDLTYAHGDYVMSGGRTIRTLLSTVVRVTTESGVEGFGEVCPLGANYLPGYGSGAPSVIAEFASSLIGLDVENLGLINHTMDATLAGHGYAKSVVDIACWDAYGKCVGDPAGLHRRYGATCHGAQSRGDSAIPAQSRRGSVR